MAIIAVIAGDDGAIFQPSDPRIGTAGTNSASIVTIGGAQTLTAKTLTSPTVNGGTLNGVTITGTVNSNTKIVTAQVDATTTTLADVTGLTGITLVAGATYSFDGEFATTCGGTGGVKLAFNYTTATLTSIECTSIAMTASAVATAHSTTTTTQTSWIASNTANTYVRLTGVMVVNAGGTMAVQFAENSANSTSSILVNSRFSLSRIA